MPQLRHIALLITAFDALSQAQAQDRFEIHVYEYEPLKLNEYSLEAHVNITATDRQVHLTLEPTIGISENFALGFMFLNAREPGSSPQYAGWRILPHFYAPESWHLPFQAGFVAEFSFQNTRYEENSRRVELRPILDRDFSRIQLVFNPVFERALHGPGTRRGWNFEPALLVRWKRRTFSPSVEYYGAFESINVRPRAQPQVHQLFLGGDWRLADNLSVNLGAGFDVGSQGPGVVLKSRFEWDKRKRP